MLAKVPQLDIKQAGLQTVSLGQISIGPITVGELVLNGADFTMSAAQGVLQNVSVTVTLRIRSNGTCMSGYRTGSLI